MKFKMTTEAYGILNDMPGYKRWDGRDLLFRPVMACVAYIAEHFGPTASWCDGAEAHLETLAKVQADAAAVKLAKASITATMGPTMTTSTSLSRGRINAGRSSCLVNVRCLRCSWNNGPAKPK